MHEIRVPKLNTNDGSYVLVEWLAADGEELATGSPVAVIETSKAAEELAADEGGLLQRIAEVNAECMVGSVIGLIFPTAEARLSYLAAAHSQPAADPRAESIILTRSAREAAEEFAVGLDELASLGKKVLKRRDVEEFAARAAQPATTGQEQSDPGHVRLSAVQQAVAHVVTEAHRSVPAAFAVIKVPVDAALGVQAESAATSQLPVGLPELVVKATASLRERFPLFFASYQPGGAAELTVGAHIGITLDLGMGLYVPVIKHSEAKSVSEIADILADYRISALRGRFSASELAGGNITISLSNEADIVLAMPIVFPGQACMISLCGTQEELYRTADGNIGIRHYVNLMLAYDHRLVNGRDAALFLRQLRGELVEPGKLL